MNTKLSLLFLLSFLSVFHVQAVWWHHHAYTVGKLAFQHLKEKKENLALKKSTQELILATDLFAKQEKESDIFIKGLNDKAQNFVNEYRYRNSWRITRYFPTFKTIGIFAIGTAYGICFERHIRPQINNDEE